MTMFKRKIEAQSAASLQDLYFEKFRQVNMETTKKLLLRNKKKTTIIVVIAVALALNAITFALAYPGMFKPSSPTLSKDFSAYYIGGWRLFNNPTKVYAAGSQPGDYPITPRPQTFKYIPSFLLLISPFLLLSYQDAFIAFNIVQLALMPVLAFFVYKLVEDKNLALAILACIVVLIDPLPSLPMGQASFNTLNYRFSSINPQTFSWSYYWGYVCGNAHILQPVFLVGAMFFGFSKKPWLSALMFALGAFDPRFALLALPLIIWYNRKNISRFAAGAVLFLSAMNLPFFFYYGVGFALLRANASGDILSQMYAYDWIPLYAVLVLTLVELLTVLSRNRNSWKSNITIPPKLMDTVSFFHMRLRDNRLIRHFSRKDQTRS
jgi:hypothetical protein